ncbi:MAG: ATP-binding protein [Oscillospiraceae bacterium]|nr:ATP-binding protein [Oscillospiraceae bacterium]
MVILVYGAPCSGKSAYVDKCLKEEDVVCDRDRICGALSNGDIHDADLDVQELAGTLWERLLEEVRRGNAGAGDVYVTSIANTPEQLKLDAEKAGADRLVYIWETEDVCLERAKKSRPSHFQYLIQEWFRTCRLEV